MSGYQDSNLGPPGPKPGALPDCATPRNMCSERFSRRESNTFIRTTKKDPSIYHETDENFCHC